MAKSFRPVVVAVCGFVLVGCYELHPTGGTRSLTGTKVALDINDAGRVALGGQMGPEISRIEGLLTEQDSAGLVIAVSDVYLLRGGSQQWRGEKVRISSSYVNTAYERRFSPSRTGIVSAIAIAVIATFATKQLVGAGTLTELPVDTSASTVRIPRP